MLHLMVLLSIQTILNNLKEKNSQNFKILKTISSGRELQLKKINKYETVEVMTGALIPKIFDTIYITH